MSKLKKNKTITTGNSRAPKTLSNNNEKKIANFDKLLTLKTKPKNRKIPIFTKKKNTTDTKVTLIDIQSENNNSFDITNVKFMDINKKVIKLTLSVNAFSSLKYWFAYLCAYTLLNSKPACFE